MIISERLSHIADMVDSCETIADIGTDHAYLPIYLLKTKKCRKAIATDINKGPVKKALANIRIEGMEENIECRLGSGLSTVKPGEVEGAIIAGMGGHLITDILEDGMNVFRRLSFCILQPVQHSEVLRRYICEKGFQIIDEDLCKENDKYYEIIKIKYNKQPEIREDIYYEISPTLINKKHQLLKEFIEAKVDKNNKVLISITEESDNALKRKEDVKEKNYKLEELLKCLYN